MARGCLVFSSWEQSAQKNIKKHTQRLQQVLLEDSCFAFFLYLFLGLHFRGQMMEGYFFLELKGLVMRLPASMIRAPDFSNVHCVVLFVL